MAHEVEKLQVELANVDKRGRAVENHGGAYVGNYGSIEMGFSFIQSLTTLYSIRATISVREKLPEVALSYFDQMGELQTIKVS